MTVILSKNTNNKAINQLDFEIVHDSEIRREVPVEEFNIKTGIKNRNSEPMSPNRLKNYGIEKWVDKDTSDIMSANENRSSLVSDSANQKALEIIANTHMKTIRSNEFFSRHSDHINNPNSLSKIIFSKSDYNYMYRTE